MNSGPLDDTYAAPRAITIEDLMTHRRVKAPEGRVIRPRRRYDFAVSTRNRRGRPPHADVLTPAEWRVVHAVQHGMTNRDIAQRRGISVDAVKFHVSNAMAKLGVRNRKALRMWFRAPKESALKLRKATMTAPFKISRIGQVSRSVKDIRQAAAWYGDVLGLAHLYTFGKLAFFDLGGTRLLLTQEADSPAAESILYLLVSDIEVAHETLRAREVEFINAPHLIHRHPDGTEEWMAFFKDPEGRPLALMSQVTR
jgi:DNA-binding CsgD family transcriptional regulator/catechol 2,3-dioxygenase-like lactoylglutathione lyase family enzyme